MSRRFAHFGSIRKLPSGRYQARYKVDGTTITAPETFTSKTAAQSWLDLEHAHMLTGQLAHGHTHPSSRAPGHRQHLTAVRNVPTLSEYAAAWLPARQLADATRRGYEQHLRRWVNADVPSPTGGTINLGSYRLDELTPSDIRAWHSAVATITRANALGLAAHSHRQPTQHPARIWAREQGMHLANTGKLPEHIVKQWQRAGCPRYIRGRMVPEDQARNAGAASTAYAYRLVQTILNAAVEDELIYRNPARIRGAAASPTQDRAPATPEQVRELAEQFPERLRAAVIVAAYSGLRSGELFGLAREHVDLDTGALHIRRALHDAVGPDGQPVYGAPKTKGSRRTVYLPAFVVDVLREHMAEYTAAHDSAPVFTSNDGRTPVRRNTISQYMRQYRDRVGLPGFRWHDLRHTGATLAYSVGASVPDVQARLGHTTMRAAMIYAHSADQSGAQLAQKLNDAYAHAATGRHLRAVS